MRIELANKQIFNDFTNKTILNDNEIDILIRYIKKESIIKMSEETNQSTASISRIIAKIKIKYEDYKKTELAKMMLLLGEKWDK